ncbi:MAG: hypothetical protein ACOCYZ_00340 [Halococcoides sp.]
MTLSISDAFTDGAKAFTKPAIVGTVAAFALFELLSAMLMQTLARGLTEFGLDLAGTSYDRLYEILTTNTEIPREWLEGLLFGIEPTLGEVFPLSIGDLPPLIAIVVATLFFVALAILTELIYLLAVRATAGERYRANPLSGLHFVVFHGILAGLITMQIIFTSFVPFVLPAIVFAILFSFVPQVVALDEVNAFRAIADSVGHVWDNALRVGVLAIGFFVAQYVVMWAVTLFAELVTPSPWITHLLVNPIHAVLIVLWLTIATEAYLQIRPVEQPPEA